ncbi:peptidoglycan D,D-transpeptidase FtsI family protein [Bacillus massiliigorillae]|uniref:peptidoglycan D,D-transpeptidase FtsI family protein n=1 Tax=Bacillus massiliigorillae TaxID=1243664 RepID=UPI001E3026B8|nr:penicillin-binding protein 2 [Bacillus massiliigorillae]
MERTEDIEVSSGMPRGRMYDRYGRVVVDNVALDSITFTREQNTTTDDMLKLARKLSEMIKVSTDKIRERDKKDYWLLTHEKAAKKKITKEDDKQFKAGEIDDMDIYHRQLDRITKEELNSLSNKDLQVLAIFREMNSATILTPQPIKNKNVTRDEVAEVSEHLSSLPGIDVIADWERMYPFDKTLRTVLGNVSKPGQGIPADKLDYYLSRDYSRNDRVGTSYIEAQYEDMLKGQKEKVKKVTDRSGNVVDSEVVSTGQPGNDLVLTIDMGLQTAVDKIVTDEMMKKRNFIMDRAFVVMMNPNTGEILAMSGKQFVKDNGKTELQDYALGTFTSAYVSGSVVKGATVLTGYQTGALHMGDVKYDTPIKIKGTQVKKSWKNMGSISDLQALKQSSNVYMFRTAMDIAGANYRPGAPLNVDPKTFDTMRRSYNAFGLGVPTGIDLPNEATGYVGHDLGPGKLLDFSIGQFDTYTPLQLVQYVSTIANGGKRIQPHIMREIRESSHDSKESGAVLESNNPKVLNTLDMKKSWIERVQKGFEMVMQQPGGTGYNAFHSAPYKMAGKTGTAQTMYAGPDKSINKRFGPSDIMNLSMIGYAPADNPEIAISVVVPWAYVGSSGHSMNLDIARKAMGKYFELKKSRTDNQ